MANIESLQQANRALAEKINQEARTDPQSPHAGKFIGIAGAQVIAIGDDLDEVVRRLRTVEPDPAKTFCIEAVLDYSKPQFIWGM